MYKPLYREEAVKVSFRLAKTIFPSDLLVAYFSYIAVKITISESL